MKINFQKILAITLCALQIVPFPVQASKPSSAKPTVVFFTTKNGGHENADAIVEELIQERFKNSLNVIDSATVTQSMQIAPVQEDISREYSEAVEKVQKAREAYVISDEAESIYRVNNSLKSSKNVPK